jgi:RNA polymerase sigma factor (sigma-70 family)
VEASALPASVGLGRTRIAIGVSLLRIRSDEQLVTFFREGNDDAFRVIHDRYRQRLDAYTHRMLSGSGQDPEGAVQEIFIRAHRGLRANKRDLALRAWLFRIAHNRCVDELRRPQAVAVETIDAVAPSFHDPVARAEQRDVFSQLVADIRRLPDQQRSALLMRELSGMTYAEIAGALDKSETSVKSLLVRARESLADASVARNTACAKIREDLIVSHDAGVRTSGLARRHMRDCSDCRRFRTEVRGVNRSLAALAPTLGPLGVIANLLGLGGGGAATGGAIAGGGAAGGGAAGGGAAAGAAAAGAAAGTGAAASSGLLAGGATHMVTLLAAAVVTAGGAVELHNTLAAPHHAHHRASAIAHRAPPARARTAAAGGGAATVSATQAASSAPAAPTPDQTAASRAGDSTGPPSHAGAGTRAGQQPLTMRLDPDNLQYVNTALPGSTAGVATEGVGGSAVIPSSPATGTGADQTTGPGATGTSGPVTTGTSGPGATGTSGPVTTGAGAGATSSPTGATTSATSASSDSTSSTSTQSTAGAAQSTNGSVTTAASGTSSSSGSPAATTSSVGGATASTVPATSVSSTAASSNSSKVPNVVATKHPRRHKVLVGRLL